MFKPQHTGLTFTTSHIKAAQDHRDEGFFVDSWTFLNSRTPANDLENAQLNGFRYRFTGDIQSGASALTILEQQLSETLARGDDFHTSVTTAFVLVQCLELVRKHPDLAEATLQNLLHILAKITEEIGLQAGNDISISEALWLNTLRMATSIALENETQFQACVTVFHNTIEEEIHPEGYLPQAINAGSAIANFLNQIRAVQALALTAEMAKHAGFDLYSFESRGVSVLTATTYPLFYYFFPEQWKWVEEIYQGGKKVQSEHLAEENSRRIFRDHAGFLEILNHHYGNRPLKAIRMILDELRPVYDIYGGGLTTLTHGYVGKKRRGWFG